MVLWTVSLLHQFKPVCNSLESICCISKMLTEIPFFVKHSSISLSC